MAYRITQDPILSVAADAAVLCVEIKTIATQSPSSVQLAGAADGAFRAWLKKERFLPVGSAGAAGAGIGPFREIILVATPRWMNAQGNEILILHYCYRNVFRVAEELGCKSVVMPFLSTYYYRFPREDAVHAALAEAEKTPLQVTFVAESGEVSRIARAGYRKPEIRSYIGYYRDHAIFELDDGRFVRVDIRPEIRDAVYIHYFAPCYRVGNNPKQPPLPPEEIERLKGVYARGDW